MTQQVPEHLIYNGERTPTIDFFPSIPGHLFPQTYRQTDPHHHSVTTACWRGYVGTWEIKGEKLYLVDLSLGLGLFRLKEGETGQFPLFANWFSGVIRIPIIKKSSDNIDEDIDEVGYFNPIYEQELHIKIEEGIVIDLCVIENKHKETHTE